MSAANGPSGPLPPAAEIVFVLAPGQNVFFGELMTAMCDELQLLGVSARIDHSGFPDPSWGTVYVVMPPHEYESLTGFSLADRPDLLARTILVCAEQPGTPWFQSNIAISEGAGALFDINQRAVDAYRQQGVDAVHLQLGYTRTWDRMRPAGELDPDDERSLDVVYLASDTFRRARGLARCADLMWKRATQLVIASASGPIGDGPNVYTGNAKLDLLRRAQVLLNIHRDDEPYFEWLRVIEAFHCGAVVVTESSTGFAPLLPGAHFLSSRPETLASVLEAALDDHERLSRIRRDAYQWLLEQPLADAARAVVTAAQQLLDRPTPARGRAHPAEAVWRAPEFRPEPVSETKDGSVLRQALKDLRLDVMDLRRQVTSATNNGPDATTVQWASAAYRASTTPRVSVITALFNHADHIEEALESVRRSRFQDLEVIVVDDGSSDGSGDVVAAYAARHPEMPLLMLRHPGNRGLGNARNTGVAMARGEYLFVLDSDNRVFPSALGSLVRALDNDVAAAFAYGVLQCFDITGPSHVVSHLPWQPERLRAGNYIDAMAMVRTTEARTSGGYTNDRRLYGWEDFDLWCGFAERGAHGVLVPNFVGSYRVSPTSMLAMSNLSHFNAYAALAERHPRLMAGVGPPR
ncbi:MAG: glycosyltransferase [Acidimicrobiia bacterium]|nr:glycosyltransferase [Acidimicrobiia bacterium]